MWFRSKLETLGLSKNGLAQLMLDFGDDRQPATIVRCLRRMATGEARVAGEMRAFLGILERLNEIRPEAARDDSPSGTVSVASTHRA